MASYTSYASKGYRQAEGSQQAVAAGAMAYDAPSTQVNRAAANYAHPNAAKFRRARWLEEVLNSLPHPIPEDQLDQEKASAICNGEYLNYARWKGGYVEINDDLFAKYICPADLLGVPCEHDELENGCQMIRLCRMLTRFNDRLCPRLEPINSGSCPHIHHEIDISCRFIAVLNRKPDRVCKQVMHKHRMCGAGHDFPAARQMAHDKYFKHRQEAADQGSQGVIRFRFNF